MEFQLIDIGASYGIDNYLRWVVVEQFGKYKTECFYSKEEAIEWLELRGCQISPCKTWIKE